MNATANDEDPRLRALIETLDDCRRFYLQPMPASSARTRELNERKAGCFAAMLAEITEWQARQHDPAEGTAVLPSPSVLVAQSLGPYPPAPRSHDDFNALVNRINRIHDRLFPTSWSQAPAQPQGPCENPAWRASSDPQARPPAHKASRRHRFRH